VSDLVRETGYAFVFPYYTPDPDAKHPTQLEESYAVIEYIAAHGAEKGLKTDKFTIAGDNVGGEHDHNTYNNLMVTNCAHP
jgi:acetyl esterase